MREGRLENEMREMISARLDCRPEYVRILAVIVAELELRNIQRQILLANLVESTNHAALNQRPEAFDCVGVDRADNVFTRTMIDNAMWKLSAQMQVSEILVSADQADFVRGSLVH